MEEQVADILMWDCPFAEWEDIPNCKFPHCYAKPIEHLREECLGSRCLLIQIMRKGE